MEKKDNAQHKHNNEGICTDPCAPFVQTKGGVMVTLALVISGIALACLLSVLLGATEQDKH